MLLYVYHPLNTSRLPFTLRKGQCSSTSILEQPSGANWEEKKELVVVDAFRYGNVDVNVRLLQHGPYRQQTKVCSQSCPNVLGLWT